MSGKMAKRVSVISDETLLSEAGLQGLSKRTPLLPQQVTLLTGLSVAALKERRRTKPPKPPLPMLREKAHGAVWYSFGSVCDYLDEWLPLHVEAEALHAKRLARSETQALGGFSAWLNAAHHQTERWPCAIIGPHKRPVDAWATIRGEVTMGRSDPIRWLTLPDYLEARLTAAHAQSEAEDHAAAVATAKDRRSRAGIVVRKTRVRSYP
jgi:hypothetical protein